MHENNKCWKLHHKRESLDEDLGLDAWGKNDIVLVFSVMKSK